MISFNAIRPETLPRLAGTVALGAAGGITFNALNLPLPWMLGALITTLVAALLRAPLQAPARLRPYVVAVIGVMLGASFSPETFAHVQGWLLSLGGLMISVAISALIVVPFYIRIGRMDPVTALFASMPGGLNEMMEVGRQYGGDDRAIILAHAARIVMTIALIAFWFRVVLGLEVGGVAPLSGSAGLELRDALILIACGVFGSWAGLRLNLPAPTFLGPMLLSAAVHMGGLSASSPPGWSVIGAQVLLGTIMGCRFLGMPPARVLRAIGLSFGATAIMIAIALICAVLFHRAFGQTTEQVLLAYAPGGLTEMSLVALSMHADVAYIATHHMVRVVILLAVAPALLGRIAARITADQQTKPRS